MLKQDIKTIDTEFIQTYTLSQLSLILFRPYETSFLGLLLPLMLIFKSKKTLEMSLVLTPSFKTSVDARVEGLVSNADYCKIGAAILFNINMEEKDVCHIHVF